MLKKFFTRSRLNNESGIILVTVSVIIIVLMVLTMTLISINTSQILNTEAEYRRIQATELLKGVVSGFVADQNSSYGHGLSPFNSQVRMDGKIYNLIIEPSADELGINGTRTLTVETEL
jgi:hypothetical protein